jgi:hypothetical protein
MNISKDFLEQTILFSLLVVEKINKLLEKTYKEDLLVSVSFIHYCTSTSDLPTLSSSRGLTTLTVWEILS